jgi:hypothetical protein
MSTAQFPTALFMMKKNYMQISKNEYRQRDCSPNDVSAELEITVWVKKGCYQRFVK